MTQESSSNLFELQIDHQSNAYLSEAAKWARFLAIIGFIFCGLFVLFGLFAGTFTSVMLNRLSSVDPNYSGGAVNAMTGVYMVVFILCALLYFFPCLYLFRFATRMRTALANNDQSVLVNSFGSLKSFYKFLGILAIIGLCIFGLEIIFVIIAIVSTR